MGAINDFVGLFLDKKATSVIKNVVTKQGMNEQSRYILEENKETIKEMGFEVIEQVKRN